MKARVMVALAFLGIATVAMATEILVNAGRWEVTSEVDYGPNRPAGLPAAEKSRDIHCLAKKSGIQAKAPLPLAAADCKLGNYRKAGSTVKLTATCEEGTLDYVIDAQPTQLSGTAVFKPKEGTLRFTVKFEGKRTGPSCSAAELAEYNKYEE